MNEILATIKNNKLRTILTAFGVFWGIFMIVLMLGIGNGLEEGVTENFKGTATNSFFIWGSRTSMPYMGMKPGRQISMKNEHIEYLRKNVPELDAVVPMSQLGGFRGQNTVSRKNRSSSFGVVGATPEIQQVHLVETTEGRFLLKSDLIEKRKITVIGENVKKILFGEESPIDQTLSINGVYFTVVGVYKSTKSDDRAESEMNQLYIPFATYQSAFNYGDKVEWIAATVDAGVSPDYAETLVKSSLAPLLRYHPDDQQALGGWNGAKEMNQLTGLFAGIRIFNWVVGLLTLVAGIVGISNIMLIVVRERTREIGIRKAIGARPIEVMLMILLETVLLTVLSGYLGIVLGVFSIEYFESVIVFLSDLLNLNFGIEMFQNTGIELQTAISALIVLVVFGTLAGLIPAVQAVKIKPIEALRNE